MTLPRTVSDVVAEHVLFDVECIDRMYLNVYVPRLQHAGAIVGYVQQQLGLPIASTAPLGKITDAFGAAMRRFAVDEGVPWIDFVKGQRKDDLAHEHLVRFEAAGRAEGVLFIGRAQEKTTLFRTEKRHNSEGRPYPWIVKTTGMVNHFYIYAVDADFGPFFLKFCSYFPYNARLCINGHEWAKRQATQAGIGFTALDNAFAAVDDVPAVQQICASLGPGQIDELLRKWLAKVPHPYSPADRAAGFRYDLSILQAEFSLTQMLDRPVTGRIFFEQVIRDNLDIGRPNQVTLIFNRRILNGRKRHSPGRFRTRVITEEVSPSLHVDYKHTTIKQYHKEGRALRTETTINNSYDFDIGKRLTNLPALCEVGFTANRRLLDVQRLSHDPARGHESFTAVNDPVINDQGTRVAGLKFADPRAQALFSALLIFRLLPNGFTNRDLRGLVGQLLATTMSPGQTTYDLRRLREHGLITRLPHSHRYRLTDPGLHHALFLTRAHDRLLRTGLAELAEPQPGPLATASRNYHRAIDQLTRESRLAA
jgi:DNA-binding transcriptional ArsR family regulator